jgi:L-rhamnose mutarotase
MERVAFVINLRSEADAEDYKRRHDEIWPEMLEALKQAGISDYSIFRHGTTLFASYKTEDQAATVASLAANPVNARWQVYMRDIISIEVDPATGGFRRLPEMFRME